LLKYIIVVLLLPTILLSSKKTIFFESPNNSDYIKNSKDFVFLSDQFIFPSESSKARYLVTSKFLDRYIDNVIFDKLSDRKKVVRTNLFQQGSVYEVYNRNIKNIFDSIELDHDMQWIDNYFYSFSKSKIFVNKIFHNKIKTIVLESDIKQLISADEGKKIFLSVLQEGVSKILMIDTVTGSKNVIQQSNKSFFVLMDYNSLKNNLLFKELKKGKPYYFETQINHNTTNPLPFNLIDRDIVEVKYYYDKFLVLFKNDKNTSLRIYDLSNNTVNLFDDIVINSKISNFNHINNTIIYIDSKRNLSLFLSQRQTEPPTS